MAADKSSLPVPARGRRIALVIFDCDGVLVDSEILAHELLAEMMTELGHAMTTAEAVQAFAGRTLTDVLTLVEGVLGRKLPDKVGRRYGRRLADRLRYELKPIPGAKAAIGELPYRCCVASSSPLERVRLSLEVTGLTRLFDGNIFSATQVAHGKPAPDLYLFAARTMDVGPADCIVVEDSPPGVSAAVSAGMSVIGFVGGGHASADLAHNLAAGGAQMLIHSMRELPAAIAEFATGTNWVIGRQ
jgi:HAD superfamily hydrolase (TIGR01509 family)